MTHSDGEQLLVDCISRPRLVAKLREQPWAIVEAGSGYGKTVLAAEYGAALGHAHAFVRLTARDRDPMLLTTTWQRALRAAGMSDLRVVMTAADPGERMDRLADALTESSARVLFVLDDIHMLDGSESVGVLERFLEELAPQTRLLMAGRFMPEPLRQIFHLRPHVHLSAAELAFDVSEVEALATRVLNRHVTAADAAYLHEATDGWPTAVRLATAAATDSPRLGRVAVRRSIGTLVTAMLDRLDAVDQSVAVQLAHVPYVSAATADALSDRPGTLGRLIVAGLPLTRDAHERWSIAGPVADSLSSRAELSDRTAVTIASTMRRDDDAENAVRLLLSARCMPEAARLVAALPPDATDEIGIDVLRELADALPQEVVASEPRVLLHVARVAASAQRPDTRATAMHGLGDLEGGMHSDPRLRREYDAERARDMMWDERARAEAASVCMEVLRTASSEETVARSRALEVAGRLCSWFLPDRPDPVRARDLLEESARLAIRLGQNTWAAQALIPLAMGVYAAQGQYDQALSVLNRASALLAPRSHYRAAVLEFTADVLADQGRFDGARAALGELRDLGQVLHESWILAHAAWSESRLASLCRDRDWTVRAVLDVESHLDIWFDQASGAEFLAMAADALDRVGEHEMAASYLERAHDRGAATELFVTLTGSMVLARSGDPAEAEALIVEVIDDIRVEPRERAQLLVLRAWAARRAGDPSAAARAAEACDAYLALNNLNEPWIREPDIIEALIPVALQVGSPGAAGLQRHGPGLAVTTFGGLAIRRGARLVELPAGPARAAIRAVVTSGGRVEAGTLARELFPVDPLDTAARRLSETLLALQHVSGDVLRRQGDDVGFLPPFDIDVDRFTAAVRRVSAGGASVDVLSEATAAIAIYQGRFLGGADLSGTAAQLRDRLAEDYLEMLDVAAEAAQDKDATDDAVRLLARALDTDPLVERRHIQLARLLVSRGELILARRALRHARSVLRAHGRDPSDQLLALARTVDPDNPDWSASADAEVATSGALDDFTNQERRIATLVAAGLSNQQVAAAMFVSVKTVEFHLTKMYRRLGLRSRTQLIHVITTVDAAPTPGADHPDGPPDQEQRDEKDKKAVD